MSMSNQTIPVPMRDSPDHPIPQLGLAARSWLAGRRAEQVKFCRKPMSARLYSILTLLPSCCGDHTMVGHDYKFP